MADDKSMREAFRAVDRAVLELETFADLATDLQGEEADAPQWPWLVACMAKRVRDELDKLTTVGYPYPHEKASSLKNELGPQASE